MRSSLTDLHTPDHASSIIRHIQTRVYRYEPSLVIFDEAHGQQSIQRRYAGILPRIRGPIPVASSVQ